MRCCVGPVASSPSVRGRGGESTAARATAGDAAAVSAQHADAEPDDGAEECRGQDHEPQRKPGVPEQEVDRYLASVLKHEDEENTGAEESGDGATAHR